MIEVNKTAQNESVAQEIAEKGSLDDIIKFIQANPNADLKFFEKYIQLRFDALQIIFYLNDHDEDFQSGQVTPLLPLFEDIALKEKNPFLCLKVATLKKKDYKKLEEVIIQAKLPSVSIAFASNFEDCDFKKHEEIIIEANEQSAYLMLYKHPNADKKVIIDAILNSKDGMAQYAALQIAHLEDENFKILAKYILKTSGFSNGNIDELFTIPSAVKTFPKEALKHCVDPAIFVNYAKANPDKLKKIENLILRYGQPSRFHIFATIPGINVNRLENKLLKECKKENLLNYILVEYAKNIKNCNLKKIENRILSLKDSKLSTDFAKIQGADLQAHQQIVLQNQEPEYCYEFAKIKGADIEALQEKILNSTDLYYVTKFRDEIEGVDPNKFRTKIAVLKRMKKENPHIQKVRGGKTATQKFEFDKMIKENMHHQKNNDDDENSI